MDRLKAYGQFSFQDSFDSGTSVRRRISGRRQFQPQSSGVGRWPALERHLGVVRLLTARQRAWRLTYEGESVPGLVQRNAAEFDRYGARLEVAMALCAACYASPLR